ncbi:Catabolic L-serine/threonine dehydratase [Candida viswanathii]|uniref:L-serine ammonia-lyase n=1 Tax=Candida viswanathii TaxID=5486 RepID=A0A367YLM0_9ASCO|nr:Catabolic L-serine/threonine dehydratase [Candida viswanathii]
MSSTTATTSTSENLQPSTKLVQPYVQTSLTEVTDILPIKPPCRVFFKNELEQPSGSFKLRGIGHLVHKSIENAIANHPTKKIHVFASSGGNAGLAAAYLAYFYKVKCTVVLPVISKPVVQEKLRSYGAEIILFGNTINEADKHLKNLMNSIDLDSIYPVYCHPFNNPLIWDGHSSLVDEVCSQLGPEELGSLKGMVCSVGGGGLYNGIYQGMKSNKVSGDILLIETKQAPTLSESIEAGDVITLKSVNSMATSLACSYTTKQTLQYYHDNSVVQSKLELIDDIDALRACVAFSKCCKKTVEPACGAALSVAYNKIDLLYKNFGHLQPSDIVVVVACGGSCATDQDLATFEQIIRKSDTKL